MAVPDNDGCARLRRSRLAAGMTQAELARAAGVSPSTISRLETGAANRIYVDTMLTLAAALNVPAAPLCTDATRAARRAR